MNDSTWKALTDHTRRKILALLRINREFTPTQLKELLGGGITMSALSHSLNILSASNLVIRHREGTSIFYSINYRHPDSVLFNYLVLEYEKEKKPVAIQRPITEKRLDYISSKEYIFYCINCRNEYQIELEDVTPVRYAEMHRCNKCNGILKVKLI